MTSSRSRPDRSAQAKVLGALLDTVLNGDGPTAVPLTNREWLRDIGEASGVPASYVRPAIEALHAQGVVTLEVGGGRRHPSTILIRQASSPAFDLLIAAAGDRSVALENAIRAHRSSSSSGATQSASWWGDEARDEPNVTRAAPIEAALFAERPLYGRSEDIAALEEELMNWNVLVLQGVLGAGKTHLVAHYVADLVQTRHVGIELVWVRLTEDAVLDDVWRPLEPRDTTADVSLLAAPPAKEDGRADALLEHLRGRRILMVLDDVHKALDARRRFRNPGLSSFLGRVLDGELRHSRLLLIGQRPPVDARGRTPQTLVLPGLEPEAVRQLMDDQGVPLDLPKATELTRRISGNALAAWVVAADWRGLPDAVRLTDVSSASAVFDDAVRGLTPEAQMLLTVAALHRQAVPERLLRTFLREMLGLSEAEAGDTIDDLHRSRGLLIGGWEEHGRTYAVAELIADAALSFCDDQAPAAASWAAEWWTERASDPGQELEANATAARLLLRAEEVNGAARLLIDPLSTLMLRAGRLAELKLLLMGALGIDGPRAGWPRLEGWARRHDLTAVELAELVRAFGVALRLLGSLEDAIYYLQSLHAAQPEDAETANALAAALLDNGKPVEALELARRVVATDVSDVVRMEASATIGSALDETGPADQALAAYDAAQEIARELGDERSLALIAARLGMLLWKIGEPDQAGVHFREARELAPDDDPYLLGLAQGDLGHWFMDRTEPAPEVDAAIDCYEKALATHSAAGVQRGCGFWLGQLGRAWGVKGKETKARDFLRDAIATHRSVGDIAAIGRHLHYLALHHRRFRARGSGRARAYAYYEVAIEMLGRSAATLEQSRVASERAAWLDELKPTELEATQEFAVGHAEQIRQVIDGAPVTELP